MTKFMKYKVFCQCCGQFVELKKVQSYYSKDITLDGYMNSISQFNIDICPRCGYPAYSIEEKNITIDPQLVHFLYEKTQNKYMIDEQIICLVVAAQIYELNKLFLPADYMYRLASWFCIEKKENALAKEFKKKSCSNIEQYFSQIKSFSLKDIGRGIILIDTTRQIKEFERAHDYYIRFINKLEKFADSKEVVNFKKILKFEQNLILANDCNSHLISEVL